MPLDDADKKFISELIATSLKTNNEEIGKQFVTADQATKMVEQNLSKGIKDAGLDTVGETLKGITGQLEKLGKGGDDDKDKGKKGDDKTDPAVARLEEQLSQLKEQNRQAEASRQQAEQARRDALLDNQIRAGLTSVGIPADRHDLAIAYLRSMKAADGKPVLRFKEDGSPVFVAQRKGYVDELDIGAGLKEWGQTDVAKVYLPPAGQGGTGRGVGGEDRQRSTTAPKDENGNLDWGAIGGRLKIPAADITDI